MQPAGVGAMTWEDLVQGNDELGGVMREMISTAGEASPASKAATSLSSSSTHANTVATDDLDIESLSGTTCVPCGESFGDMGMDVAAFNFGSDFPALPQRKHFCKDCELEVDIENSKVRVRGKASSNERLTLQCPSCNSKCVMMHRDLNEWPTDDFEELSKEDRVAFYRGESKIKKMRVQYANSVAKTKIRKRRSYKRGEFQPLSYWEKQGYDKERIARETRPEDRGYEAQLGETYRVAIKGSSEENEEFTIRTQILQSMQKKKKSAKKALRDMGVDGSEAGSDSDSDSDSDSPSAEAKKKKKATKSDKKAKQKKLEEAHRSKVAKESQRDEEQSARAAKKRENELERAEKKQKQSSLNAATVCVSKLQQVILQLNAILLDRMTGKVLCPTSVPSFMLDNANRIRTETQTLLAVAQARIMSAENPFIMSVGMVHEQAKQAQSVLKELQPFKHMMKS